MNDTKQFDAVWDSYYKEYQKSLNLSNLFFALECAFGAIVIAMLIMVFISEAYRGLYVLLCGIFSLALLVNTALFRYFDGKTRMTYFMKYMDNAERTEDDEIK